MHLLPSMSLLLTASAVYLPLRPRVDPDPCLEEIEDIEYVQLDGTTADGTAGIGAEFESPFFVFSNSGCSLDDTNAAKGEIVAERTGTNWKLTADSGLGQGKLTAEYILDGQNIKVGSGDGAKAGAAAAQDLVGAIYLGMFHLVNAFRLDGTRGLGPRPILLTSPTAIVIRGISLASYRTMTPPI